MNIWMPMFWHCVLALDVLLDVLQYCVANNFYELMFLLLINPPRRMNAVMEELQKGLKCKKSSELGKGIDDRINEWKTKQSHPCCHINQKWPYMNVPSKCRIKH